MNTANRQMLDALRRITHPMADDRDRDHALRVIAAVEPECSPQPTEWWGLFVSNVYGELEVLRDTETGEPCIYLDAAKAFRECDGLNETTDGGYMTAICDCDGNPINILEAA